jgi:hypothetical protein
VAFAFMPMFDEDYSGLLQWLEMAAVVSIYQESLMAFSMVLTTFFEDPKKASQLGYMIIFMGFIPYVIVSNILDSSQASSEIFILYGFGWLPTISILPIVELIIGMHSETQGR